MSRGASSLRLAWIALLAAIMTVACGVGPTTYSAAFPSREEAGTVDLAGEPVDVVDFTGLVTGVAIGPSDPISSGATITVTAAGNALRVAWIGGACESRVRVILWRAETGYAVRVRPQSSLGGMLGCPAVGIYRAVDIALRAPLDGRPIAATLDFT